MTDTACSGWRDSLKVVESSRTGRSVGIRSSGIALGERGGAGR